MKILAIDTCLAACSAAVWEDGRGLAVLSEPMNRGHQERLAPMAAEVMAAAGAAFADLDRIAVTVGPGSFTGLRVGLAFAKGLALALDRPCIGVGVLEALADGRAGFTAACIDANRDQLYLQVFIDGAPAMAPDVLTTGLAAARLAELWNGGPAILVGSGAPLLAGVLPDARLAAEAAPDPLTIARLASRARPPFAPPRPLYLRAPDAKLPSARIAAA
jgi:tRNA threonylcarbamoyladenosine biosynthesis protein TsaB